jgi:hypothetical protein
MSHRAEAVLLLTHAAATLFMVGLIWMVQVVHYPLMRQVGAAAFPAYALAHQTRITWVVLPVMSVELIAALLLVWQAGPRLSPFLAWTGVALLAIIWAMTLLVHVPQHGRLATAFDSETITFLVRTNWVRTWAWTLRGLLALGLLYQAR